MVSHFIRVGTDPDYISEITIQEDNGECVIITKDSNKQEVEAYLTIPQLHDFIGLLLHVQQKLKNR